MTLKQFNQLDILEAQAELQKCCGAQEWVKNMLQYFPFADVNILLEKSLFLWYEACSEEDWKEAFSHHPKIGDLENLKKKFASTSDWASGEQAGVNAATQQTLEQLAQVNTAYEEKFGYIFIVCATGKSAREMLQLAASRLANDKETELRIAIGEQHKITNIRLGKLIEGVDAVLTRSQITTHVLDTSIGLPGRELMVYLQQKNEEDFQTLAMGLTDEDGRVGDLLPSGKILPPGDYQMVFKTKAYFQKQKIATFYPEVNIQFSVFDDSHYHVPLLLNPFGYSTYRGS